MFHFFNMIISLLMVTIASISTASCPDRCKCGSSEMDCSHRKFESVPQELGSNYEVFNLSGNSIDFLEKETFKYTLNLREVYLSHNKIEFIHKETFSKLKNLQVLVLSDNLLQTLYIDTFNNNECLLHLDLHNNSKLFVPSVEHFLDIPSVVSLVLSDCNIEVISKKTFASMKNLEYLNISNNKLKTFDPNVLQFLPHLKQLEVAGNDFICNCAIEGVKRSIKKMKVCVVGKTCYNNDTAYPTNWNDLHLECSLTSSIGQTIEKYTLVNNLQTTANCSKTPEILNMLTIRNPCKEMVNLAILILETNTRISKTSTTPVRLTSLPTDITEHQTLATPARNTTESTQPMVLSGTLVFFIAIVVFCVLMIAIICILRHSALMEKRTSDVELKDKGTTEVLKEPPDQGEETCRYSATPSFPRSAGQYHNLSLDVSTQTYPEDNRSSTSEESYLVPKECVNKSSVEARQYFEKRRNPPRRLNFEQLPFPESQLHLQNNTSPSCTELLTYNSSSASYCSDYHIYEEID